MLMTGIPAEEDETAKAADLRIKLMNLGYAVACLVAPGHHALTLVEQSWPEQTPASASSGMNGSGDVLSATDAHVGPEPEVSRVVWRKSHDSLFGSIESNLTGFQYHLIVERLPSRGAWDWAVWRSGDRPAAALHGRASSSASAMAAAEAAVAEKRNMEPAESPPRLAQG